MSCTYSGQSQINWRNSGTSLYGSKAVKGDEWRWILQISDYELIDASIQFTAKCDLETPDENAEVTAKSTETDTALGRIVLSNSSHVNLIHAEVIVPTEITSAIIFPFDKTEIILHFDVRIQRAATVTSSSKVQTYFSMADSRFTVIKSVTNSVPALPV